MLIKSFLYQSIRNNNFNSRYLWYSLDIDNKKQLLYCLK
ncbi:hypothetical protein CP10139811_0722 [Chlamydia ibidis]|uniref:Uncharacterized protein n=1 Tax=Chlamydia ibidis TaxID=1405396 RepID=S7KEM8_9CHLA|nr:hypothetical protein CP10139811_0722 [Chlamydia ibidis]